METHTETAITPCTTRQRRLLRFARRMWSIPLRFATLLLLLFLLTDTMALAGLGVITLEVGGLCTIAGIIATLVVATQRRQCNIEGEDPCEKTAYQTLALLLSNFAVAGLYAYIGIAQIGTSIIAQADSPSGAYIAEAAHLGENEIPPYGQVIWLRPAGNPFKFLVRTSVFRGYCDSVPDLKWVGDLALEVHCINPSQVAVQETAYGEVVVSYRTKMPTAERRSRKGRL
jgi:hypothetical protein